MKIIKEGVCVWGQWGGGPLPLSTETIAVCDAPHPLPMSVRARITVGLGEAVIFYVLFFLTRSQSPGAHKQQKEQGI